MAFRPANISAHTMKFNSAASGDFIYLYERLVDNEIAARNAQPKHQTFAPSQMRCDRISWFRLRGVQPDKIKTPDRTLEFSANVGAACHEIIQKRLANCTDIKWLQVDDWLLSHGQIFDWTVRQNGYEQQIECYKPFPIRFACDGLIEFKGKTYLLEIKTSEFSSFQELISPKEKHIDQIECYAALLDISNVLVLYQDRQYGGLKCFEIVISDREKQEIINKMQHVMDLVEAHIAPDRLPKGDPDCTPNMCPYFEKCKEW